MTNISISANCFNLPDFSKLTFPGVAAASTHHRSLLFEDPVAFFDSLLELNLSDYHLNRKREKMN
jgi:hypothetical protein